MKEGVIPANNTAMEFDALRKEFYTGNAAFWMYGIWDLGSVAFPTYGLPKDEKAFFADWGWIANPAPEKGGSAGSLTHPVVYVVANGCGGSRARRPHPRPSPRRRTSTPTTRSSTTHLGIRPEQLEDKRYADAWPLARATELLKITKFLPNNSQFGELNGDHLLRPPGRGDRPAHRRGGGRLRHRRGVLVAQGRDRQIVRSRLRCEPAGRPGRSQREQSERGDGGCQRNDDRAPRRRRGRRPPPCEFRDLSRPGDRPHRPLLRRPRADRHRRVVHRSQPHRCASPKFTTEQYAKVFQRRSPAAGGHRPDIHLRLRHARHLQRDVRAGAGAGHDVAQQDVRRLLPRRLAPAADEPVGALHPLVAVGDQPDRGRPVEPDPDAGLRPRSAARPADAGADGADHHRQRLHRRLDGHDHLHRGDPRYPRTPLPRRRGRRRRHVRQDPLHHAAGAALADQLRHDLPDALAPGELRIHPAAHQGGPVLRHDRLCPLRLPPRLRERPVCLRRGAGLLPDRHRRRRGAARLALLRHGAASCSVRASRCTDMAAQAALTEHRRPAGAGDRLGRARRARARHAPGEVDSPSMRS